MPENKTYSAIEFLPTEESVCRHYIGFRHFIDASLETRRRNFEMLMSSRRCR